MTKLEAINQILLAIREAPVNSLEDPFSEEVSLAVTKLDQVSTQVQARGWSFNIEKDQKLLKDSNNNINVTEDVLRVEFDKYKIINQADPVLRGTRLYDRKTNSYTFSIDIPCTRLVRKLPWEDLPVTAQTYITYYAARVLAAQLLNSQGAVVAVTPEEFQAEQTLIRDYQNVERFNYFDSPGMRDIVDRY